MRWLGAGRRPVIMGILNVTPDSFSDGGRYTDPEAAVVRARAMLREGADILDIGGESTRPGAQRQGADIQISRVVPVIQALRRHLDQRPMISIDTSLCEVAEAALGAGADMVNDISAGRDSPDMLDLVAEHDVPIVLMHMQGQPATMQQEPAYQDVVGEVKDFLSARADAALQAGVPCSNILLDPGVGFGKRRQDNLDLLGSLDQLVALGFPVLLGASRKRFMGHLCGESDPAALLGATCAATALGVAAGVRVVRVHDVKANRQAADVAWALSLARK
jgi:dihydropteroate synthase